MLTDLETKLYLVTEFDPVFFLLPTLTKIVKASSHESSPAKTDAPAIQMSFEDIINSAVVTTEDMQVD